MKDVKNVPCYPINLQIDGRSCMVVGGGSVAQRKVGALLAAGGMVTVVSPALTKQLASLVEDKSIIHIARSYQQGDVNGFFIVICATDSNAVNKWAAEEGMGAGALVNVTDAPELGNFSVPSQISHGDLLLTISTGGKSPALAKKLREELEERYGPEYGIYLELVAKAREQIKEQLSTVKERESFWRRTLDQEVIILLKEGKIKEAEAKIKNAIGCTRTQS
ncbi:bifunctional precorrin-2 dehydrogenase/sirohydrochlorin ferrochelatase [Pelosinus sp. Bkl1]|uniref:precorrin-2 dehydrogenase n=1 Tax=Pelosinus baikalensis TaxID=2892015 RepID=A0ABS8HVT9_9FIRM|nr:bifunctional precorrin-2 dehydrogenase/sirohydrochlorin ferrochelatase [Pelosinus baikalensis]MCC5467052.1 bifunctional precorrin-2 dehydrogenase/sirohydrochlorin ferrochelatase [Pelosinus baikalensis]